MIEFNSNIVQVLNRTENVKSFRVQCGDELQYDPGQYMFVTLNIEGEENTKPLSFSSSPTEKGYIEFTKKITDSSFSRALNCLNEGDKIKIKAPFGKLTFKCDYENIALLSGGIGITPFRSMIRYAVDTKCSSDIVLLYGNNTQSDIVFKDDLDKMNAECADFNAIYTITQKPGPESLWNGYVGAIDENMIKNAIPDYMERIFFLCGPPAMVECLKSLLTDCLKIKEESIKTEQFAGY